MKFHVVCIWVSDHQIEDYNLPTPKKDAIDIFNGINESISNIWIKKILLDSDATLANIKVSIWESMRNSINENDIFVFYFSWHGVRHQEWDKLEAYLVPFDGNASDISNSCISVTEFAELIDLIPAKQKIIFIDSCFSWNARFNKSLKLPIKKDISTPTKITDFIWSLWKWSILFTASSADQEAFATPDLRNSLFTYYLLQELSKPSITGSISLTDIHTSLVKSVQEYLDKKHHGLQQTPCLKWDITWVINFPIFKNIEKSQFVSLDIPHIDKTFTGTSHIPTIKYDNEDIEKLLNDTIKFIHDLNIWNHLYADYTFKKYCFQMVKKTMEGINNLFKKNQHKLESNIEDVIKELQSISLHLLVTASVLSYFGTEKQMTIFVNSISHLSNWNKDWSGLVVMLSLHDIIYLELIYLIGIFSLENNNFTSLRKILSTKIYDKSYKRYNTLVDINSIFFLDIFWGYADIAMDHIRKLFLESFTWIKELDQSIFDDEEISDRILQVNFILRLYKESLLSDKN